MDTVIAEILHSEVCPSCGEFVDSLYEVTGWCDSCSGVAPCPRCGNKQEIAKGANKTCGSCKYDKWLEANADELERLLCKGLSKRQAIFNIRDRNRPICQSCGNPIKGGTKGRHFFCKKTPACLRANNSYHHYRHYRKFSHEVSLAKAKTAAEIVRLTAIE